MFMAAIDTHFYFSVLFCFVLFYCCCFCCLHFALATKFQLQVDWWCVCVCVCVFVRTHNERPTTTSTITPPSAAATATTATTTTKKPVFISAFAKGDVYRYDFGINRANVVAIYASVGVYLWLCVRAYAFCCLHFCVCMCECVSVGDLSPSPPPFLCWSQCRPTHALSILNYQFHCAYRPSNTQTHSKAKHLIEYS